ncbi:MAG: tetratricopeptide repeat protein [bacterium]
MPRIAYSTRGSTAVIGGALLFLALGMARGAFAQQAEARGARVEVAANEERSASVESLIAAGDFVAAESEARVRLEAAEREHGERSAETAAALGALVDALFWQGRSRAPGTRALAERFALLREDLFGPGDPRVAHALVSLGRIDAGVADYAAAESVLTRAVGIFEADVDGDSLDVALALQERGLARHQRGRYDDALADAERALAMRERALPADHPDVARALAAVANTFSARGDPVAAEPFARRALAISERAGRSAHPLTAWIHNSLGNVLLLSGRLAEARTEFETALAIRLQALRPSHPDIALSLNNLAVVERRLNDNETARDHQLRAIEIAETELGPDDPFVATCLSNLAGTYFKLGSLEEARPLAERALAIRKRSLPPGHPDLGLSAHNLAMIADESGALETAVAAYREALAIYENTLAPAHPSHIRVMWRLGHVLAKRGDVATAESLYVAALAIADSAYGPGEIEAADIHNELALLLLGRGRVAAARRHGEQAAATYASVYGPHSPEVALAQTTVATALAAEGDRVRAFELALEVESLAREDVAAVSRALPERQAIRYNAVRPSARDLLISMAAEARAADASTVRRVWDSEARSRAIVFDLMSARHRSLDAGDDPAARALMGEYETALGDFANLLVRNVDGEEEIAVRVDRARGEVDRLERELALRFSLGATGTALSTVGIDEALRALPPHSALIAYVVYDRLAYAEKRTPTRSVPSYGAFVAANGGAVPAFVHLGRRAAVDSLIARWRAEASRPVAAGDARARAAAYRAVAAELREKIWDPVASRAGAASDLFVVPDANLNLINFAALPERGGGYLVESGPVVHLVGAERDLVGDDGGLRTVGSGLLAMGDPDFDADPTRFAEPDFTASPVAPGGAASFYRGERSRCAEFARQRWRRLPATQNEIADVAASLGEVERDARVLSGAQATETAFKRGAPGRGIVHVATHGFFLQGDCEDVDAATRGMGRVVEEGAAPRRAEEEESPLLLSGLVFAGANRRGESGDIDDGILTAEEIGALDLRGAKCVVLSACDTGLGDVQAGEGVFGLRRAFRIAGARSLVMSLWSVEDVSTRAWMRDLYASQGASQSLGVASAVARASRSRIIERRAAGESDHPFYWAGFVATESAR